MISTERETSTASILEVLRRRKAVAIVTFLVLAIAVIALVRIHKVKYASLSHVVLVNDASGRDPSVAGADMPTIASGSAVLDDVRRGLHLKESINDLRKAVTARVAPKSSLMTIAVQDHDPKKAMLINNTVADAFAKRYRQLGSSRYDEITATLNADVDRVRTQVGLVNRRLEAASTGQSYVGSQASLDSTAAHLGELKQARGAALAQLATDSANLTADRQLPGKTAKIVRHEILANSSAYRQTEALVGKDISQYTTARAGVTSLYPGIAGYANKIANERSALDTMRTEALTGQDAYSPSQGGQIVQTARDDSAVHGDQIRLDAIDAQIKALNATLSAPSEGVESMGALRAERDADEAQLQALMLRLTNAEANSAEASSLGQVVVVDRATDSRPVLVGAATLDAIGLLVALVLAIAAAYLAELLLPRLLAPRDVESVYGRPIIATLRTARN